MNKKKVEQKATVKLRHNWIKVMSSRNHKRYRRCVLSTNEYMCSERANIAHQKAIIAK